MLRNLSVALVAAVALVLLGQPVLAKKESDLEQIKKAVETEIEGASTHDLEKVMSVYWKSPEVVLYDTIPGKYVGWDAIKGAYEDYFKTFPGKPEANHEDLQVGASGDVGYAFSIQNWTFKKADGTVVKTAMRVTNVYKKINGHWLCIHEHASLPIDILGEHRAAASADKKAPAKKP